MNASRTASERTSSAVEFWTRITIGFLVCEAVGTICWWIMLWLMPSTRAAFKVQNAPDSTLLAFGGPDFVLLIAGSLSAAFGLWRNRAWAWPLLCVHSGAAAYAALYCVGLTILSGDGWIGTALMTPLIFILPYLSWRVRPQL